MNCIIKKINGFVTAPLSRVSWSHGTIEMLLLKDCLHDNWLTAHTTCMFSHENIALFPLKTLSSLKFSK